MARFPPPRSRRVDPADELLRTLRRREEFQLRPSSSLENLPEDQRRQAEQARTGAEGASLNTARRAAFRGSQNAQRLEDFSATPVSSRADETGFLTRQNATIDAAQLRSVLGRGQKLAQERNPFFSDTELLRQDATLRSRGRASTEDTTVPNQQGIGGNRRASAMEELDRRIKQEEFNRSQIETGDLAATRDPRRQEVENVALTGTPEHALALQRAGPEAVAGGNLAVAELLERGAGERLRETGRQGERDIRLEAEVNPLQQFPGGLAAQFARDASDPDTVGDASDIGIADVLRRLGMRPPTVPDRSGAGGGDLAAFEQSFGGAQPDAGNLEDSAILARLQALPNFDQLSPEDVQAIIEQVKQDPSFLSRR